jgi:hypothetical protein
MSPLFENAVDSLEVGMQFFKDRKPKFAMLLVFHSIELLLKEQLSRKNPILIYRSIDKVISDDSQTVGLAESLVRFQNLGINLTEDEKETLVALQKRRNRVEHHRYDPHNDDRETLGRSLRFIRMFVANHLGDDLKTHIDNAFLVEIDQLILSYEELKAIAEAEFEEWVARAYSEGFDDIAFKGTLDCPVCRQDFLVLNAPEVGNHCFYCRKAVEARECDACGIAFLPRNPVNEICDDCMQFAGDD